MKEFFINVGATPVTTFFFYLPLGALVAFLLLHAYESYKRLYAKGGLPDDALDKFELDVPTPKPPPVKKIVEIVVPEGGAKRVGFLLARTQYSGTHLTMVGITLDALEALDLHERFGLSVKLARVYVTPDGRYLLTDGFKEPPVLGRDVVIAEDGEITKRDSAA